MGRIRGTVLSEVHDAGLASCGEEAFYRGLNLDMVSRRGGKTGVMLGRHGRNWGSLTWGLGFWPGLWAVGGFCRVFDF